jgi:transcriptional regulator with XRE-family HTH domain
MSSECSPGSHGQELTTQLRMLRERAGLSQEAAGLAMDGSRYQVCRIEGGRVPAHEELLAMLALYQATPDEQSSCLAMWELAWRPGRRVRRKRLRRRVDS